MRNERKFISHCAAARARAAKGPRRGESEGKKRWGNERNMQRNESRHCRSLWASTMPPVSMSERILRRSQRDALRAPSAPTRRVWSAIERRAKTPNRRRSRRAGSAVGNTDADNPQPDPKRAFVRILFPFLPETNRKWNQRLNEKKARRTVTQIKRQNSEHRIE